MWREYVTLPDGKQKSIKKARAFPHMSERAARAELQSTLDRVNRANTAFHLIPEKVNPTVADAVAKWRTRVAFSWKPRSRRSAESHITAHISKLNSVLLSDMTAGRVQDFVAEISPGRSGKMVINIVATLNSILKAARTEWNFVPRFGMDELHMPEVVPAEFRMPTPDQLRKLIAASKEPLTTILRVLRGTGLRINECLALAIEDIDFENGVIHVRHSVGPHGILGTPKSKSSHADVPMGDGLVKDLRAYLDGPQFRDNPRNLVFVTGKNNPYMDNNLRVQKLMPLLRKLKLPRIGFHGIRHMVATQMMDSGASVPTVQRHLRHSDSRITMRYAHVINESHRKAVNDLERLIA